MLKKSNISFLLKGECPRFALKTSVPAVNQRCRAGKLENRCPSVQCNTLASGWIDEATCQRYTFSFVGACSDDGVGYCKNQTLCKDTGPRESVLTCGSRQCRHTDQCENMGPVPTEQQACITTPEPNTRCPTIACTDFVQGWDGNRCARFKVNVAGRCGRDSQCMTEPQPACQNDADPEPGLLVARCVDDACRKSCPPYANALSLSASDVCHTDVERAGCPPLACPSLYAGFDQGNCMVFAANTTGVCVSGGRCGTFSARAQVVGVELALRRSCATKVLQTRAIAKCASRQCADSSKCSAFSLVDNSIAASDLVSHYCVTNADQGACPQVKCTATVRGWSSTSATCLRYGVTSNGYCDGDGKCIEKCEQVPKQSEVPLVTCPSAVKMKEKNISIILNLFFFFS